MEKNTTKQIEYLDAVNHKLYNLRHAFFELSETLLKDTDFGFDTNLAISPKYPFDESLDELALKVREWSLNAENIIDKQRKYL